MMVGVVFEFGDTTLEGIDFRISLVIAVVEVTAGDDEDGDEGEDNDEDSHDELVGENPEEDGGFGDVAIGAVRDLESGGVSAQTPDLIPLSFVGASLEGEDIDLIKSQRGHFASKHVSNKN